MKSGRRTPRLPRSSCIYSDAVVSNGNAVACNEKLQWCSRPNKHGTRKEMRGFDGLVQLEVDALLEGWSQIMMVVKQQLLSSACCH